MKLSTFKRRIIPVLDVSRQYFSRGYYRQEKYHAEGYGYGIVEINSEHTANLMGVSWNGRPYLHIDHAVTGYDMLDHVFDWFVMAHYFLSGEYEADMCREADDRLLANAYS